ncbi:LysM peptidoglycan-binding domain-containing protein [Candidatus Saccharibacteria bacterium]|nr:LysM peptidoglycan-binding domain-containing protein [Candidatus Saccharibacteria bacterium]
MASTTTLPRQSLHKHTGARKKSVAPSASKIAAYAGAFLLLVAVVAVGYESPQQVSGQVATVSDQPQSAALTNEDVAPSVDQVVATDIAADLASRANLPIATNVVNLSISLAAKSELAQTDASAITKPQIIQPNSTRTEVINYVTVSGDSVPSVATKFGISANTVRWVNDLGDTDVVAPGKTLAILPISGLLHTVVAGDTLASIASKYNASADRIVTVNNLELSGVSAGQKLVVPDGAKPAPVPVAASRAQIQSYGGDLGGARISSSVYATAGNRYAAGNCTWYAYERRAQMGRPVGSFWGNANTWASNARAAGFAVNRTPAAGAVFTDQAGYFGHVGVVERVLGNGDVVVTEMNNYAYGGFNIVNSRTISAGQASAYQYIHD